MVEFVVVVVVDDDDVDVDTSNLPRRNIAQQPFVPCP